MALQQIQRKFRPSSAQTRSVDYKATRLQGYKVTAGRTLPAPNPINSLGRVGLKYRQS
jgi:hypothetical protein